MHEQERGSVDAVIRERRLTVEELLALPEFGHLKPATLSKWRTAGNGPPFIVIGRKPFYPLAAVERWLKEQEKPCEAALTQTPYPAEMGTVRRKHRLTGNRTRSG